MRVVNLFPCDFVIMWIICEPCLICFEQMFLYCLVVGHQRYRRWTQIAWSSFAFLQSLFVSNLIYKHVECLITDVLEMKTIGHHFSYRDSRPSVVTISNNDPSTISTSTTKETFVNKSNSWNVIKRAVKGIWNLVVTYKCS